MERVVHFQSTHTFLWFLVVVHWHHQWSWQEEGLYIAPPLKVTRLLWPGTLIKHPTPGRVRIVVGGHMKKAFVINSKVVLHSACTRQNGSSSCPIFTHSSKASRVMERKGFPRILKEDRKTEGGSKNVGKRMGFKKTLLRIPPRTFSNS